MCDIDSTLELIYQEEENQDEEVENQQWQDLTEEHGENYKGKERI